ncbi:PPIase [Polyrhizophydium stewartii]|uniref:peptidylprolyl isomerase n=1 Tax=Polyrhizophydium stewartii TaxID=2732419 RepID=A0ABR4N7N4_9FUNG|nr:putative inactive peptidyl-prolyl cis-trans isomerase-like 6 [Polyrhizophydium stewartii]
MPPTAATLRFVPKTTARHKHSDHRAVTISLTGSIKDPRFHQAKVIAQAISSKMPDLVNVQINGLDQFEYALWIAKMKPKYPNLVEVLVKGCLVEIDSHKVLSPDEFAVYAKDKFSVTDARPLALYSAMANTAFNDHVKNISEQLVVLRVNIDKEPAGQLLIQLYGSICPTTVAHFLNFVEGGRTGPYKTELVYKGCRFDRLCKNGWIQTGHIVLPQGKVYQEHPVADENFIIKHDRRGVVSMVNSGPNSNYSAFMITFKAMPFFDRKYVAIGHVIDGADVLDKMEAVPTRFEQPEVDIEIASLEVFTPNA